jgi:colanic acid/amylovoran biosynthesis glycosyltransferase
MQHIYRQVTGLTRYRTVVLAEERCQESLYPFSPVDLVPPPQMPPWRRLFLKYLRHEPQLVYRGQYAALRSVVDRHPAALLHIYFGHSGVHLLPFIERWPHPTVVSFHGMDAMPRPQHKNYLPRLCRLLQKVPLVLVRSQSLGKVLIERGCDPSKIRLNRTSVPLGPFPFKQREEPADGAWQVIQASRLIEKKGLDLTLQAFARFRSRFPRAQLSLVGDGPLLPALQSLAEELGVREAVSFPGFLAPAELANALLSAHLFIHPSRKTSGEDQEGVPNSLLEAMATGLPIVATRHGGIPEVIRDGENGVLCPENEIEPLANALLQLAGHPEKAWPLGASGAETVRLEFSPEKAIAALEAIYDEAREMGALTPDRPAS